jgi:hypothetical protein
MRKEIPAPVIAVLAENLPNLETHAELDNLFLHADAPGDPPEGSKPVKTQAWLRRIIGSATCILCAPDVPRCC